MKRFVFIFFSLISLYCRAQYAQLKLQVSAYENDSCFSVVILNDKDTVYNDRFLNDDFIKLDSLKPGVYKVMLYQNKAQDEAYITRYFSLFENKTTDINLDVTLDVEYNKFDQKSRQGISNSKGEQQINLGYFNNNWADKSSPVKQNFSIGLTTFYWYAFSKHVSLLNGIGVGLSQHYYSKDTSTAYTSLPKKSFERYTYFKTNFEFKLRFTSGDARSKKEFSSKLVADIGVGYYLPIVFRHVTNYSDNLKVVDRHMHNFKDCRAFVNIGYYPCQFFFEYRLTDFVFGNYPQLPVYNTGIKLLISMH